MTTPKMPSLDPEEQQLLDDFEAGKLRSLATPDLLGQLQQTAKATDLKDRRIYFGDCSDGFQAI